MLVDVNDRVKKGQVLVELDTAKLRDQIPRSRATLAAANAKVAQTVATVKEAQATSARFEEVARLSGGKVPSQTELDTARATLERARADEASARAERHRCAGARCPPTRSTCRKASIRAPSDGVVLTRNVDPGNAVAASLQAVTLFTVAEDLKQLRLQVNVDEADVGSVTRRARRPAFTVSAYPGRKYPAVITRVAYGSTITDNVVTYVDLPRRRQQRPEPAPRHDRDRDDHRDQRAATCCWCPTPRCASRRRAPRGAAGARGQAAASSAA